MLRSPDCRFRAEDETDTPTVRAPAVIGEKGWEALGVPTAKNYDCQ